MIRVARPADIEAMIEIWLRASKDSHDFIPFAYWEDHVPQMRKQYLPRSENFVEEQEGKVVGFLSLAGCKVAALFVAPEAQSRGVGASLLAHARSLRDELTLTVFVKNVRAVAFYEREGFQTIEERLDEDTGESELFMGWTG